MTRPRFTTPTGELRIPTGTYLKCLARIAWERTLPPRWSAALAAWTARVRLAVNPRRRKRLERLYKAFAPTPREMRRLLGLSRAVKFLGSLSHAAVFRRSRKWLLRTLRPEGLEHLEEAKRDGRGAIVLATHAGCLAWVTPVLRSLGYPVKPMERIAIHPQVYMLLRWDNLVGEMLPHPSREDSGPHLKGLLDLLRQGIWIQHLGDFMELDTGFPGVYLGQPVRYTRAPWVMARLSGAPLIPVLILMDARCSLRLIIGKPIRVGAGGQPMEAGFQSYLEFIGRHVAPVPWNVPAAYWEMVLGGGPRPRPPAGEPGAPPAE